MAFEGLRDVWSHKEANGFFDRNGFLDRSKNHTHMNNPLRAKTRLHKNKFPGSTASRGWLGDHGSLQNHKNARNHIVFLDFGGPQKVHKMGRSRSQAWGMGLA